MSNAVSVTANLSSLTSLTQKALELIAEYEFTTFLVGIELPAKIEEREDEFKGAVNIGYGESIKHEFGRLLGKALAKQTGKEADYLIPDMVVVFNPFLETVRLQVNPLFVAGRYRKLVRTIPQSKWFCSRLPRQRAARNAAEQGNCILNRWRSCLLNHCFCQL